MDTIYYIVGAVAFWLISIGCITSVFYFIGEYLWRRLWPDGLKQFKNYYHERNEFLKWKAEQEKAMIAQDQRIEALNKAGVKVTKKVRRFYE